MKRNNMGDLAEAFSFADYAQALRVQSMMAPGDLALVETIVLGSLGIGAVALFIMMFLRRSGTAAAGFALVALVALAEAILFGRVDFLTPASRVLIGSLTASALLVFVNAVLHTGRENIFVAGVSALTVLVLLGLAGVTAAGLPYGQEARMAILASAVLSGGLLVFAMIRDIRGKGFLGFSIILAILASTMMTGAASPMLNGFALTVLPAILAAVGILLAALSAPFLADEVRMPSRQERAAAKAVHAVPTSLFADDDDPLPAVRTRRAEPEPEPFFSAAADDNVEQPRAAPPIPQFQSTDHEPEPSFERDAFMDPAEPVSNYWNEQSTAAPLEAADDEYVWDALAQPEVRCGRAFLDACGAHQPGELTPEGIRGRLAPHALELFDEHVLGGGDPVSGPFEVNLQTQQAEFLFKGRRQVDHDGLLMRIDGFVEKVTATKPVAADLAPAGPAPTHSGTFDAVVRLGDHQAVAFEASLGRGGQDADEVKALIDDAGRRLAKLLEDDARRGPFALVDASQMASLRPGIIAAAVGKAVRHHKLPKGAMVVGLAARDGKDDKALVATAEDIRKAGGGIALVVDEKMAKGVKFEPDMVWASALDLNLDKRQRKSPLAALQKRFKAPIVVRDISNRADSDDLKEAGASFGIGHAFDGLDVPGLDNAVPAAAPSPRNENPLSALRAGGLR